MQMAARPPTTPPAIAPVWVLEWWPEDIVVSADGLVKNTDAYLRYAR